MQNSARSHSTRNDAAGGSASGAMVMAVSMRKSFWLVPASARRSKPRRSAAARNMARWGAAPTGCDDTSDTLTSSRGTPAKRSPKSSVTSTATPPRPTSDAARGSSDPTARRLG